MLERKDMIIAGLERQVKDLEKKLEDAKMNGLIWKGEIQGMSQAIAVMTNAQLDFYPNRILKPGRQ